MNKVDIWTVIVKRLRQNTVLAGYVKNVFSGNRDAVLDSDMPCIMVHPLPSDEVYADFPKRKQDFLRAEIRAIFDIRDRFLNNDDSIIAGNTAANLGAYKFETDIKNALENITSGASDDLSFENTAYYPKLKTIEYSCSKNASFEVVLELEVDGRYFFAGQR